MTAIEACPAPEVHGNPFRYCPYCDWRERPTPAALEKTDLLGYAAYKAWMILREGTAAPIYNGDSDHYSREWSALKPSEREAWRAAADAVRMMVEWQAKMPPSIEDQART